MIEQHAIRAARNRYVWGRDAAMRYIMRHGVSPALYRLACQLVAGEKVEELERCKAPHHHFRMVGHGWRCIYCGHEVGYGR
jgi:hypothetical protein